jgi:methylglutaconyl-CoA hydratase
MTVLLQQQEHIAYLTLQRPEKCNALHLPMLQVFAEALTQLRAAAAQDVVKVVVLQGGKHFSSGADLQWFRQAPTADLLLFTAVLQQLQQLPCVTVAKIQGVAFGGALGLIAACDLAIAAADSQFALPELQRQLVPALISPYLQQAGCWRACLRYILSGEVFSAAEALSMGLVQQAVPPELLNSTVQTLAAKIASYIPASLRALKRLQTEQLAAPQLVELLQTLF